jgi:hypothetical protein
MRDHSVESPKHHPVPTGFSPCIGAVLNRLFSCCERDGIASRNRTRGDAVSAEHTVARRMKSFAATPELRRDSQQAGRRLPFGSPGRRSLRHCVSDSPSLETAPANFAEPDPVCVRKVFKYGHTGDPLSTLSTPGTSCSAWPALTVAPVMNAATSGPADPTYVQRRSPRT